MKEILSNFLNWRYTLLFVMGVLGLGLCFNEADVTLATFLIQKAIGFAMLVTVYKVGQYWSDKNLL